MSESTSAADDPDADPGNLQPADLRDVQAVDSVREDSGSGGGSDGTDTDADTDADPDTLR